MKNLITEVGLFDYELKPAEIVWAVIQGVGAFIATTTTAPLNAKDWETWVIAAAAAGGRAAVAAVFGKKPT